MYKRILMIADSASFWTKNYVLNLLVAQGWEVVIFPIWEESEEMNRFYAEHGVTVYHDAHRLPVIRHIPRLRMWARIYLNAKALQKLGPFDVVHNHILSQRDLALGYLVHRRNPKSSWLASFWGSDLLRVSVRSIRQLRFFLKRCDHVTTNAESAMPVMRKTFSEDIVQKTTVTYFGQHIYGTIDTLKANTDKRACKEYFGLNPDQPVLALGYNASPTQHHLEMLDAIGRLPADVTRDWALVLQITYGSNDPAYLTQLKNAAQALLCRTLLLTDPMDETECAYLRIAADVYVHAIPTDFLSATLREYLYAGAQVLCGDWLPYPEFRSLGIEMIPFSTFGQLEQRLPEAVQAPISQAQLAKRLLLKGMFSWEAVGEKWNALYHK
ncbi:MAG TPA: glycosyltransferase [Candidatus Limiplasma sp.]|nr:glycosyltransferase [Candidatus Limiplasma sp.]